MTWLLMWLNRSVISINAMLQFLVIYRLVKYPCDMLKYIIFLRNGIVYNIFLKFYYGKFFLPKN